VSDINRLSDVFTYCSDSGLTVSWLDHVICSSGIDSRVSDIAVLYGYMGSDHRPLSVSVANVLCNNTAANDDSTGTDCIAPDWSKVDDVVANDFSVVLNDWLQNVLLPHEAMTCCSGHVAKCTHLTLRLIIDQYYSDVISCIKQCVDLTVPTKLMKHSQLMYTDGVTLYRINMMSQEQPFWSGFIVAGYVPVLSLSIWQDVGLCLSLL